MMLYNAQVTDRTFSSIFGLESQAYAYEVDYSTPEYPVLFSKCIFNGDNCLGGLKIFASKNFIFNKCQFYSGSEKCLSIACSACVKFINCIFNINRNFDIDIFAGSNDIMFEECYFKNAGEKRLWSCLLGKWSEREVIWRPPVRNVSFVKCKFDKTLRHGICIRSKPPNVKMLRFWPALIDWSFHIRRLVASKNKIVGHGVHETEL